MGWAAGGGDVREVDHQQAGVSERRLLADLKSHIEKL